MKTLTHWLIGSPFFLAYEGETPPPPPAADPLDDVLPDALKGKTTFDQKDVNAILAKERTKAEAKIAQQKQETEKRIGELEKLSKAKGLSDAERTQLATQIEEMKTSIQTKEQLSQQAEKKLKEEHQKALKAAEEERESWKQRFTTQTINNNIISEALTNEAFEAETLIAILSPQARLVPEADDEGNATGVFIPKVKFPTTDKAGKPLVLDLTIAEAVKQMKDQPKYGHLFKSTATGGLGGTGGSKGGKAADPGNMTPEQYREWRKSQNLARKAGG